MTDIDGVIDKLLGFTTSDEHSAFLSAHPQIGTVEGARQLCRRSVALGSQDLALSEALCAVLDYLAAVSSEPAIGGYRDHARAALLQRRGIDFQQAVSLWRRAISNFEAAELPNEVAISISCALTSFAYMGDSQLVTLYERARAHFEATGDCLRQARLLSNFANCFFWRDEFSKAAALMEVAYQGIVAEDGGGPELANMLNNLAACYVHLGDLPRALYLLEKAQVLCEERKLNQEIVPVLENLAYTRMLQGDLVSALDALGQKFAWCKTLSEHYYSAVTIEAEILLNLCLGAQAQRQARCGIL